MPTTTTIPFSPLRFPEDALRSDLVEQRLQKFLRKLREDRQQADLASGCISAADLLDGFELITRDDKVRIGRRAAAFVERVIASSGMQHLGKEDRARLEVLRHGVTITGISSEDEADVIAAQLHEEMPWMAPATEHLWYALRRCAREGLPGLRFPPLLLVGPSGIGKTHWARRLGKLLGRPTTYIDATSEPASFSVVGSQRGWGSAEPGKVVTAILRERCASPVVLVDEVEKAGVVHSNRGVRFTLTEALLPLLEPSTAATWQCPYFRIPMDMSWVGWVLTANDLQGLPDPLLSRCPPMPLPCPSRRHLIEFARREAARRKLPEDAIWAIEECLASLSPDFREPSLRTVLRMIDRAERSASGPTIH